MANDAQLAYTRRLFTQADYRQFRPDGGIVPSSPTMRRARPLIGLVLTAAVFAGTISAASAAARPAVLAASAASPAVSGQSTVTATVDGVTLTIGANALPAFSAIVSEAGSPMQVAILQNQQSSYEFTVTVVPDGHPDPFDFPELGTAKPGNSPAWAAALGKARDGQGGASHPGPAAHLFGQTVNGIESQPDIPFDGVNLQKADMIEWVTEAGTRTFIIRISKLASEQVPAFGTGITLDGTGLSSPSSIGMAAAASQQQAKSQVAATQTGPLMAAMSASALSTLSEPSWWGGTICDTVAGHSPGSSQLGSSNVRGIIACGPNNDTYSALGWKDFECTELAGRYMYQAGYITGGYAATGGYIVANYAGSKLTKVANGHASPSSPASGDVVSMGTRYATGHVALVLSNQVNSSGNGTITVLQQNFSSNGLGTMQVVNGVVRSEEYGVSGYIDPTKNGSPVYTDGVGWLHDTTADAPPPVPDPTLTAAAIGGPLTGNLTAPVTLTASVTTNPANTAPKLTAVTFKIDGTAVASVGLAGGGGVNIKGGDSYAWIFDPVKGVGSSSLTPTPWTIPANLLASGSHTMTVTVTNGTTNSLSSPGYGFTVNRFVIAPSAVIMPSGQQDVFAKSPDGHLYHWYYNGTVNGPQDWTAMSGGGDLVGTPLMLVGSGGRQDVFGRGSDGHLHHWYYDGTVKYDDWLGDLVGDPSGFYDVAAGYHVFGRGSDGHLHHWYYNGTVTAPATQDWGGDNAGTPTAMIGSGGRQDVFGRGSDGHLHHWYYDGTVKYDDWLGDLVGDPSGFYDVAAGYHVFGRGSDGHLHHWYYNGTVTAPATQDWGGTIALT